MFVNILHYNATLFTTTLHTIIFARKLPCEIQPQKMEKFCSASLKAEIYT